MDLDDLKGYIHNNYKIADERDDVIKLVFDVGGMRSQVVIVWHVQLAGTEEDWIEIESPIGELGQVDLAAALQHVGNTLVGGLALAGGNIVTFRHSVPLDDLASTSSRLRSRWVTGSADRLEQALTGGDKFRSLRRQLVMLGARRCRAPSARCSRVRPPGR